MLGQSSLQARTVRNWSIDELTQAADLVVVVDPIKNEDNSEKDIPNYDPRWFQGVSTTFQIKGCFKGTPNKGEIVVKHFKYKEKDISPPNGPDFIFFVISPLGQPAQHWVAFLKKAPDGSYVPVTDQYDAILSFKELHDPSFYR